MRASSRPPAQRQGLDAATFEWGDVTAVAPDETPAIDLRSLWYGFRRRWVLALGLGIVGSALAGVAGWFLLEPHFTATGYLRIASSEPKLVSSPGPQGGTADFEVYKRTQKELILGRYVLNAALRSPKAAEIPHVRKHLDPVVWLAEEIKVDFPGNAEIMSISMSGEKAEEIATLVNAVVDAYQHEVVLVEKNLRMDKLDTLEKVARDAEEKSRRGRADLHRLADTLGTGDAQALTLKQQIALQRYATMLGEQTRVQIALMQAEIDLAVEKAKQDSAAEVKPPPGVVEQHVDAHPRVAAHRKRIEILERKLAEHKESAVGKTLKAGIENHERQIDTARQAAAAEELRVRERAEKLLGKKFADQAADQAAAKVAEARNDVNLLKTQQASLQKELETLSDEANKIGRSSIDVEMMRAEIEKIDDVAHRLGSEIENIRIELQSPARITLLSRAEVPAFKDTKKQLGGTAGLAVVWFLLPVFGIAWRESKARRIYPAAGTRQLAGVRVLGALPLVAPQLGRRTAGRRAQRALQNRMAFRESIDGLRTTLLREAELAPTQVVMVTSASCGEGKTSVASQLALSIARARCRCLLVDFDLRRPAAHRALGLPAERGMCEVLRGELDVHDVIQETSTADLSFIAAGTFDDEALVALTQRRLPECLAALRPEFEFIILDSSPILPVVDAVLVGKHVDAVVFSVLCDVSQTPKFESALSRLDAIGAHVLGVVVTGPSDVLTYEAGTYQYMGPT